MLAAWHLPVSVAVSGVLVGLLGPVPFFPVAGAVLAVAIPGALTQREVRIGVTAAPAAEQGTLTEGPPLAR